MVFSDTDHCPGGAARAQGSSKEHFCYLWCSARLSPTLFLRYRVSRFPNRLMSHSRSWTWFLFFSSITKIFRHWTSVNKNFWTVFFATFPEFRKIWDSGLSRPWVACVQTADILSGYNQTGYYKKLNVQFIEHSSLYCFLGQFTLKAKN